MCRVSMVTDALRVRFLSFYAATDIGMLQHKDPPHMFARGANPGATGTLQWRVRLGTAIHRHPCMTDMTVLSMPARNGSETGTCKISQRGQHHLASRHSMTPGMNLPIHYTRLPGIIHLTTNPKLNLYYELYRFAISDQEKPFIHPSHLRQTWNM